MTDVSQVPAVPITKPRIRKPALKTTSGIVAKIKADVQAFTGNLVTVTRDTSRLAPLVAEAFRQYKDENADATKLGFCKLFATREQQVGWPETDMDAKASGSRIQALFNGIDYLLRKAVAISKAAERQSEIDTAVMEAVHNAKQHVKDAGLKGEDATAYIEHAKEQAKETTFAASRSRLSQDDVVAIITDAWYSDMDEYDVFVRFVHSLLVLKYKENTATAILNKATAAIDQKQDTVVVRMPGAPVPAAA